MGIFAKKPATGDLFDDLAGLRERVSVLESDQRRLELDYLDTYQKVKRLMSRIAKTTALDRSDKAVENEVHHDPYSHLDQISADIMRRRGNGVR